MDGREPTLSEIIHDPSFCALLRHSQRAAMTWDDFLEHPLPPHMSPLAAWETLGAVGECIGVSLFPDEDSHLLWYRRTHELGDLVASIGRRASRGSPLHESLLDHADRSFSTGLRIYEATAAARLGGLAFDCDHLEMHVRLGTLPEKPTERIIANAVILDADLASFSNTPFNEDLLIDLRRRLYEGVDEVDDIDCLSAIEEDPIDEEAWSSVRRQVAHLLAYVNDDTNTEDSVILRGNLIADAIRYHQPFGFVSALIASLASRLYYLTQDLPVLALVPVSSTKYRWTEGTLKDDVLCTPAQHESTRRRSPCDLTVHQTLSAQCIDRTLDDVETLINGIVDKDRSVRRMLSVDTRFNHRQRSILARAVRTPNAEFHIRYHQEKHRISYATARRDLVELESAGYLRCEQRGKAFVFLANENIDELSRAL